MEQTNATPKETLLAAMAAQGVTVDAVFVPWSRSRHYKPDTRVGDRARLEAAR